MPANTFGTIFCLTSFGESHGPALGGVVTGCPPGLPLNEADFAQDMARRRPGSSRHVTQRREADKVELLSGVFEGMTTGTPIGFIIRNTDSRSQDYDDLVDAFRPGHGDYTYWQKYGIRDYRGGGRASARETVVRVAAGVIARKWLSRKFGITIRGFLSQLGPIPLPFKNWEATNTNPFFCADETRVSQLEEYVDDLRKSGDSVGGRVDVLATDVPVGWGEPVFHRLDADLASAMMGINAAKAVEIGDGVLSAAQKGSQHSDEMSPEGFLSNHAGGVLAGISSGQDVRVRVTFKPTSSIRLPRRSINKKGEAVMVETKGRHDPCVALRATPIVEAMMALVLMDHALMQRTREPDVLCPTPKIPAEIIKK